jgi:NAD(P)-dependent dehydrogenase (short-subunit alcohol dehydrogenase family)
MNTDLVGKVVFITGAAGGIGRASALAFAAEGADLGLVDRNALGLAGVADEVRALGVKAEAVSADLATPRGIQDSIATLLAAHGGRVDVLVCAAGILTLRSFDDLSWEDWEAGFRLHCLSPVWTSKLVLPVMREQGSGCILMVASDLARQPEGIDPPYETGKGGLLHATKLLARSEGPNGVRVKRQAATRTGLPPEQAIIEVLRDRGQALGRLGQPPQVAATLVFLASAQAAYITGATLNIDGGTIRGLP